MANPTTQTLILIGKEGLRMAGVKEAQLAGDPDYTAATTYWQAEVSKDIQNKIQGHKLIPFQNTANLTLETGKSRYSFSTDMMIGSPIQVELLYGTKSVTADAGSTTGNIVLDAGHGLTTAGHRGKEIYCYSGTGPTQEIMEIISITTNTVDISETWSDAPDDGDKFFIVDEYKPLNGPLHIAHQELLRTTPQRGTPTDFWIRGDSDYGEIHFDKAPERTDGISFAIRMYYYVDLMNVDLTSTRAGTLRQLFRNEYTWGVYVRKLKRNNDPRYESEFSKYMGMLDNIIRRYSYDHNVTNLQAVVDA